MLLMTHTDGTVQVQPGIKEHLVEIEQASGLVRVYNPL